MPKTRYGRLISFIARFDGYFAGKLDNGGFRVGAEGINNVDVPADHPFAALIAGATNDTVEAVFDTVYGAYA